MASIEDLWNGVEHEERREKFRSASNQLDTVPCPQCGTALPAKLCTKCPNCGHTDCEE